MKNFQEAIELIISNESSPLNAKEIAALINEKQIFKNWKGEPVTSQLVLGRASQHLDIFEIKNDLIGIKKIRPSLESGLKELKTFISHRGFKTENIILFFSFWAYMSKSKNNHWLLEGLPKIDFITIENPLELRERLLFIESKINSNLKNFDNWKINLFTSINTSDFTYFTELSKTLIHITYEMNEDEFREFFQSITELFSFQYGRQGFSILNPPSLTSEFFDFETKESYSVFDPFCGTSLLLIRVLYNFRGKINLTLQDNNTSSLFISLLNLEVAGFHNYKLNLFDFNNYLSELITKEFDYIITDPPIINENWIRREFSFLNEGTFINWEDFYIKIFLQMVVPNGTIFLIISDNFLSYESNLKTRKFLLDSSYIREVYSGFGDVKNQKLPKKSLLILNQTNNNSESIKYHYSNNDESNLLWKNEYNNSSNLREFKYTTIKKLGANLDPGFLLIESKISQFTSNWQPLSMLLIKTHSGFEFKKNEIIKKDFIVEQDGIPYVRAKDLNVKSEFLLNAENVENRVLLNPHINLHKINQNPGILLSRVGSEIKPKIYDGSFPIFLSTNVYLLEFDQSKISYEFAFVSLQDDLVKLQFQLFSSGSGIRFISKKYLEMIRIPVGSLEEQKERLKSLFFKNKEKTLVENKDENKKETEILSSIKHELKAQILEPLATEFRLIKGFGDKILLNSDKKIGEYKITQNHTSRKFKDVVNHVEDIIKNANNLFENIQQIINLNTTKIHLERTNILKLIKECVDESSIEENGIIAVYSLESPNTEIYWKLDKAKIKTAISNFIRNTINHAFKSDSEDEKYLIFNVEIDQLNNSLQIHLIDNGVGLIGGFMFSDLVEFGKQNKSSGNGIGGYLMKKSIEIHEGTIEDITEKEEFIDVPKLNYYPFKKFEYLIERTKIKVGVHFRIMIPNLEL